MTDYSDKKVYIAGHNGMVGSALVRFLNNKGFSNLITADRNKLDLLDQRKVSDFLLTEKPDLVIVASAKVGGIQANSNYKADFLYQNLQIQNNLIHGSHQADINNLIFLGSSCIYPKESDQPIKEDYLLGGFLEETNEPYAIAKIAGLKMCESYRFQYQRNYFSLMPCNLYGYNDNYDLNNSHVLPALLKKMHEAKINNQEQVEIWGSGNPRREFLFVDDLAEACFFFMENNLSDSYVNIGTGRDVSIKELVHMLKEITGFQGIISNDLSKPDGTFRKLLDVSKATKLGWTAKTELNDGIKQVYLNEFLEKDRL